MHELSIASAMLEIAQRSLPRRLLLKAVRLRAGPMRAIEPDAMQFAWQAVIEAAGLEGVRLELELLPWTLRCGACGEEWTSERLECTCPACGSNQAYPIAGDQLQIVSIQVDDQPVTKGAEPCETSASSKW